LTLLRRSELRKLMDRREGLCASVYMPTHRTGNIEQDSIRLRNLLAKAEKDLIDNGLRAQEAKRIMSPGQKLLADRLFWQYQADGLALFMAREFFQHYRLPYSFPELSIVGERFHIKPLLTLLSGDGLFYILALSQNEVRLIQCTRDSLRLITPESIPKSLTEALEYDDPEKQIQYHTVGGGGSEKSSAIFHGHGVGIDDKKDRILRFFQKIDHGLHDLLKDEEAPLVMAGVDYLHPIYRKANRYPNLLNEGIIGNPEGMTDGQLHERAWVLIEPYFEQALTSAVDNYGELVGTGLTTDKIESAVLGAYDGRISTLFVAGGVQLWGVFDNAHREVRIHETAESGDEDLLDLSAVHTLLTGGIVYVVELERMPSSTSVAAILRY